MTFIENLLVWTQRRTNAQNVVWLLADELEKLKAQAESGRVPEPDQLIHREAKISSLKPVEMETLLDSVKAFSRDSVNIEIRAKNGAENCLVPLCDPTTHQMLAAILVLGHKAGERSSLRRLSRDFAKLGRHARFCLQHWEAQLQTLRDDLTGLYNQKFMAEVVDSEIARAGRSGSKFSVLFIDIDHFKLINDHHGHFIGSKVLVELARIFQRHLRKSDYAFRYGGDEFVIILPDTDTASAHKAAERIRDVIQSTELLVDGAQLKVTISVGIAGFPDHANSRAEIIRMADAAMYCGKQTRNVVYVANS